MPLAHLWCVLSLGQALSHPWVGVSPPWISRNVWKVLCYQQQDSTVSWSCCRDWCSLLRTLASATHCNKASHSQIGSEMGTDTAALEFPGVLWIRTVFLIILMLLCASGTLEGSKITFQCLIIYINCSLRFHNWASKEMSHSAALAIVNIAETWVSSGSLWRPNSCLHLLYITFYTVKTWNEHFIPCRQAFIHTNSWCWTGKCQFFNMSRKSLLRGHSLQAAVRVLCWQSQGTWLLKEDLNQIKLL